MTIIQGNASDDVKQKLSQIPIQKLLNAARSNKPENISGPTKEILLLLLQHLSTAQQRNSAPNTKILLQMYQILNPNDKRNKITLDDLMAYLRELSSKIQKCSESQAEIDRLKAQLETLKNHPFTIPGINMSLQNSAKNKRISELETQLETLKGSPYNVPKPGLANFAEQHKKTETLKEQLNTLETKFLDLLFESVDKDEKHRAAFNELSAKLSEALKDKNDLKKIFDAKLKDIQELEQDLTNVRANSKVNKDKLAELQKKYDAALDLLQKFIQEEPQVYILFIQIFTQNSPSSVTFENITGLEEAAKEIRKLKAELEGYVTGINNSNNTAKNEKIAELEGQRDALQAQLATLQKQYDEAKQQLLNSFKPDGDSDGFLSEDEINELKAKIELLEDQKAALQSTLDEHTEEIRKLRLQVDGQQTDLSKVRADLAAAQAKLAKSEASKVAAESQLITQGRDAAERDSELEGLNTSISEARETISGLELRIEEFISARQKDREGFEIQLATLRESLDTKEAERKELYNQNIKLEEEVDRLTKRIDELTKDRLSDSAASKALTEEIEKARVDLERKKEKLAAKQAELDTLKTDIDGKTTQIATLTARVAELEGLLGTKTTEASNLDDNNKSLRAELERVQRDLATATDIHNAAVSDLQAKLSTASMDSVACRTEIDALQARLADLEGKASRVDAAEQSVESLHAELEAEKAKLAECTKQSEDKQTSHNAELASLRAKLEKAEAELAEARSKSGSNTVRAESAEAQVKALQGEIDGLKGTGTESQKAFDTAKAALDTRISELEEQLKALDTSKADAVAAEKSKCEEHVAGLQKQLNDMKAALEAAKAEAQSSVSTATTEAAASKAENTNKITSLSAELETIKGQLAAAKATEAAAQAAKVQSDSDLSVARANAATQRARANAAEGALGSKVDAKELEAAKETIAKLEVQLSGLADIRKEKSGLEITKQRLSNILTTIAISPAQKAAVQKILDGDESADLSSFYSTLDKETCDFFHYLYDTINIQLRYIHEIPVLKKNEELKNNIFKIYTLEGNQNKEVILEELTRLLQQFFVKFNPKTGIPDVGIKIDGKYPELQKLFSKVEYSIGVPVQTQLRDDLQSSKASESQTKLSAILKMGSFFPDSMKIQKDDTAFTDKQTKSIPLSILTIRLIQLLHETFEGKYMDLKMRCGSKNTESSDDFSPLSDDFSPLSDEEKTPQSPEINKLLNILALIKEKIDIRDAMNFSRRVLALTPGSPTFNFDYDQLEFEMNTLLEKIEGEKPKSQPVKETPVQESLSKIQRGRISLRPGNRAKSPGRNGKPGTIFVGSE